ncbi:hypothetical protein [Aquimarina algiphila]|uniref:hypothetical protein n=1 Tax=Aquimarina algiphila TaxID=2047982 RepID=UPI00233153C7|nr:hypothetical protein [Aquimarina algiphila]
MKNSELDKNKFISSIIDSIKMNVNDFMQNLANGEKYETTIYEWSINLFKEGKSIDDAIKVIHEKRMLIIFNSSYISSTREELITARNRQRIMTELNSQPIYINLNEKQKASIQKNIDVLVESKLRTHSTIIKLVLELIKQNITSKKWNTNVTEKSRNKIDPDDNESTFLSKFKNYLNPKIMLNETLLPSS